MPKILPILGILFLTACASKPQLYPNHKFKTVGKEAAKKDIDQCLTEKRLSGHRLGLMRGQISKMVQ